MTDHYFSGVFVPPAIMIFILLLQFEANRLTFER